MTPHPEDHPRQQPGGGETDHGEGPGPSLALEAVEREVEEEADDERRTDGGEGAEPHGPSVRWRLTPDVGEHDGDDQCRLEALAKSDQKAFGHVASLAKLA